MDTWKIYNYMCHYYPELKEKYTISMIREQFDDALKKNKIFKKHSLYYFHVKHKEKLNGIDRYLNVKLNVVPAFDSKDIKSNLNLFLKRPGLYIGTNRFDYSRIFIGNIPGGENWNSDYDIQNWLFVNESILIPHAISITGWNLLPIYFGNRQKALDVLRIIVNEIPFTLNDELSFINLPSLLVYNLFSLYHYKFLDRRDVIENTQSKLYLHKQVIEETFAYASYSYKNIINIVKRMIKEDFSKLYVYIHYQNFFLQVRFIYLNKKEDYIDLINLRENEDYFANLVMLHAFAELAQKEEYKSCIVSLKYADGKEEISRFETKDIWSDIFSDKVDISTADKNTLCEQYETWKLRLINEK